jgi:hypothetical protein
MLSPIASALDYAHSRDIVHRDVKPANILVARDGTPVLADFGLANTMMTSLPGFTQTGTMVGTPEYMPPEVGQGEEPGPLSDQYALAVVAYEMLTGQVPYAAATPLAVLLAHTQRPLPKPTEVNPALTTAVEEALLKGLAKTPEERYPSCSAMLAAIGAAEAPPAPTVVIAAVPPQGPAAELTADQTALGAPAPALGGIRLGRTPALIGGIAVGLVVVGLAAVALIRSLAVPSDAVPTVAWQLASADDFSNPDRGLFLDKQGGSGQESFGSGATIDYRWAAGYESGEFVGRVGTGARQPWGPFADNRFAEAKDVVSSDDFALEVRARVAKSADEAGYGLRYTYGGETERYLIYLRPSGGQYQVWWTPGQMALASGSSRVINGGHDENVLRMEVRGDTLRLFVNGQEVDRVQHEGLLRRPGKVALAWLMDRPPAEGEVEVHFRDFKLYSLDRAAAARASLRKGDPPKLLSADDFSDPARGLFLDNRGGSGNYTSPPTGVTIEYRWAYLYRDNALIGQLGTSHPQGWGSWFFWSADAAGKLFDPNFSAEVHMRAAKSASQAFYGLRYAINDDDYYTAMVVPGTGTYVLRWSKSGNNLAAALSPAIKRGTEQNQLRIEVFGDALRLFANGREVDRVQHDGLSRRPGTLGVLWGMSDPPSEGDVEARFNDLKVYALAPE